MSGSSKKTRLHGLKQLTRLGPRKWTLAAEAGLELLLMKAWVLMVPPAKYAHLIDGDERWPRARVSRERITELVWAVEAVGQYAPPAINCLPRALALQRMLRRRGVSGSIVFGVRREPSGIAAHAWLVLDGTVLIGRVADLSSYVPFPQWPTALRSLSFGAPRSGRRS